MTAFAVRDTIPGDRPFPAPARGRRRWLAGLPAGALLVSVGGLTPVDVRARTVVAHVSGETTIPANPQSVLVFHLAALDILDALGVEPKGVPGRLPTPRFEKYDDPRFAKIGSLFEPDLEAVHAARPDLIIVAGRSQAKYADLAKVAPTIDLTVKTDDLLPGVFANTALLGRIFRKDGEASALVDGVKGRIRRLQDLGSRAGKGLIVLTTGGKMSAYGPGSRFGVLHDSFGIAPVQAKLKESLHGQAISFEFILQQNPDWLFVIDRDAAIGREGQAARRMLDNQLVHQTVAWKKKQVVYLDPVNWYSLGSAGIIALRSNIDQLIDSLGAAGA